MTVPTTASVNIPLMIEQNVREEWQEAKRHLTALHKQISEADAYVRRLERIAAAAEIPLGESALPAATDSTHA